MSSPVEQIKERLSIADVVSSYIKLDKAGSNFKAICPFHSERTPSFFVSPTRNTYHCFGCNHGGDIFSFIEEIEGIDFKGALKLLADRAGVKLAVYNKKEEGEKNRLHTLLEDATVHFQKNLTENTNALSYLYKRGLSADTLKSFRIGFAKDSWDDICDILSGRGYSDSEIEQAGLAIKKQEGDSVYDRFRSRIMFPITDTAGRTVAFSGRIFDKDDSLQGKYINSPETVLYHKSKILYGYDRAKEMMRKKDTCVLVEGQMDLLLSHSAGTTNTVAISGTALSKDHVAVVKRLAQKLILAFDADDAGFSALKKSALMGLSLGLDVRAVAIPEGFDPADLILKDRGVWNSLVENALHVVPFLLRVSREKNTDKHKFSLVVVKEILPLIKCIQNKVEREHFIKETSEILNIPEESVREEIQKVTSVTDTIEPETDVFEIPDERVPKKRSDIIADHIGSILMWQGSISDADVDVGQIRKEFERIIGDKKVQEIFNISVEDKKEKTFEVEIYFGGRGDVTQELNDLLVELKKSALKDAYAESSQELKQAEEAGNQKQVESLLARCQEIAKEIANL